MGAQGKPPALVCNSISCPSPSVGADGWEGEQVELTAPSLPLRERQGEKKNQSAQDPAHGAGIAAEDAPHPAPCSGSWVCHLPAVTSSNPGGQQTDGAVPTPLSPRDDTRVPPFYALSSNKLIISNANIIKTA